MYKRWFILVSAILVLFGMLYATLGLKVLPVNSGVLLNWESDLYGAIMTGWGVTLLLVGKIAFNNRDRRLKQALLAGVLTWLAVEAISSAVLGVWFNVGVDFAVALLFALPLIQNKS